MGKLIGCMAVALAAGMAWSEESLSTVSNFNFGWRFRAGAVQGTEQTDFDDRAWTAVDLPHDFQIDMPW